METKKIAPVISLADLAYKRIQCIERVFIEERFIDAAMSKRFDHAKRVVDFAHVKLMEYKRNKAS
jgi:hypothetical protein